MFQDALDTLALALMFTFRIGLPMTLTLAVGVWLEKKLAPRERAPRPAQTARSAKIIPIHSWDIKKCARAPRAQCAVAQHPELPCWLALQVAGEKVGPECYACAFYKPERIAA